MPEIIAPRRNEVITTSGAMTQRFAEFIERLTGSTNNTVNQADQVDSSFAEIARQNATIAQLSNRIGDLEDSNDTDLLNSRIAQIGAKVTRLIDELIVEIRALNTSDVDQKSLAVQSRTVEELELLNIRIEEAFETDLDRGDIE